MSQETSPASKLPLPVILSGLVLLVFGVLAARYVLSPHSPAYSRKPPAHYLQPGKPLKGFALIDYDHQPFTPDRLKGRWTFMFFGYTNCPDVCPTTLLKMKSVWNKLPAAARARPAPQMVFVSVDPKRDTPERLKKYVTFYHPGFLGVTGKAKEINKLTHQVGVQYSFTKNSNGGYTVNHSAQIILVDPKGEMRAVFSPPHKVEELLNGYIKIRNYYEQRKNS
ncbi:MAG: SCO family protein [Gammaproteobacteria bacterium]